MMKALLNKCHHICYQICKLDTMFFMDMSYANTFVQGWINLFNYLLDLFVLCSG